MSCPCRSLSSLFAAIVLVAGARNLPADPPRTDDSVNFRVFMRQGGWCWFQDPRVILHDGKLIIGGVEGNGSGDAVVGIYDLQQHQSVGRVVLHKGFRRDDHNSPVFYLRGDGRVLAVYALHGNNKIHYYRISDVSVDPVNDDQAARGRSPLKLFESWACGVPIVTADVGDRKSLLSNPPAGLLSRAGDADSLARSIDRILENHSLADTLSANGLIQVERYYWDVLAKRLENIYHAITA